MRQDPLVGVRVGADGRFRAPESAPLSLWAGTPSTPAEAAARGGLSSYAARRRHELLGCGPLAIDVIRPSGLLVRNGRDTEATYVAPARCTETPPGSQLRERGAVATPSGVEQPPAGEHDRRPPQTCLRDGTRLSSATACVLLSAESESSGAEPCSFSASLVGSRCRRCIAGRDRRYSLLVAAVEQPPITTNA
jgi:hypothetical protein